MALSPFGYPGLIYSAVLRHFVRGNLHSDKLLQGLELLNSFPGQINCITSFLFWPCTLLVFFFHLGCLVNQLDSVLLSLFKFV